MATKTSTKFASKPVATAAAQSVGSEHDAHRIYAEATAKARDEYLGASNMPSQTRVLVSKVAQFLSFSTSIYWGVQATGLLVIVATAFTGSAFIGFCIALITSWLAISAAWETGVFIRELVLGFNTNTLADTGRDIRVAAARKVSLVKGWFKRDDVVADPIAI
jgi:hypothetical protein